MNGRLRSAGRGVLLLSFSLANAAGAQLEPDEPPQIDATEARDVARDDFRRASRLAQSGDWAAALSSYSAAQARYPHATTLYNIGYCYEKLGDFAAALRDTLASLSFDTRFAGRGLAADLRERALRAAQELRVKVAVIEVSPNAPDLELRIDGSPLETFHFEHRLLGFAVAERAEPSFSPITGSIGIVVNEGAHRIEWRSAGTGETRQLSLVAGATERLELPGRARVAPKPLSLSAPPPAAAPQESPNAPEPAGEYASSWARPVGVGSLALAGTAALVGLGASFVAYDTQRSLDERCTSDGVCPASQAERIQRFETATTVADIGFVSAAVFAGAGVALLVWSPASPASARLELRDGPGLRLRARF
jgi:hypothetical protein